MYNQIMEKLDISALKKAKTQLEEVLQYHNVETDFKKKDFLRMGCIQAFEFTYELSWKMILKYQKIYTPTIDETQTFTEIIRYGINENLLNHSLEDWNIYRKARNSLSHTYDGNKAEEILKILPEFLTEATFLLSSLEEKLK